MTPKVSVVVATYNCGRYLAAALDFALSQSFADFEILVVDDGSTDDTSSIMQPYLRDDRVRYHCLDHCGQPAAKNFGIRTASAPVVAFLDADDIWLPDKLAKQLALLD